MKKLLLPTLLLTSLSISATEMKVQPYVGAEYKSRFIDYMQDFSGGYFAKNIAEVAFFAGFKFNENFGIELSTNLGKSRVKTKQHNRPHPSNILKNKSKMYGLSLMGMGFLPLNTYSEMFCGLGLSHLDHVLYQKHADNFKFRVESAKPVLKGMVGFNWKVYEKVSLRTAISMENTTRLRFKYVDNDVIMKPKKSFACHSGLAYNF